MFALSVCEILTVEMWTALTLIVRMSQIKCKHDDGKVACHFLFLGDSNVNPICPHLRDIRSRNVHDLDFDLDLGL